MPTMFEGVPAALHPPVDLALAKAVESIPHGTVLSGDSVFEMKFDGFRAACFVGLNDVWLYSRQGKDLSRYFPDVWLLRVSTFHRAVSLMVSWWCGPGTGWISMHYSFAW